MKLLVDADILLYRAASSVEREIEFEDDVWVLYSDVNEAKMAFNDQLAELTDKIATYGFLLCFSDNLNFRKNLYPAYKSNRTKRKPMAFHPLRERINKEYGSRITTFPGIEADDVMGIHATLSPDEYIIWSADKDLKQIPGKHLVGDEIITITKEEGDYYHYLQTLTGDTSDGYPGCPGVGPVKAKSVLKEGSWDAIVTAYEKTGLTEADALTQARLARILRADDWDFNKQEVRLWLPQSGTSSKETASAA